MIYPGPFCGLLSSSNANTILISAYRGIQPHHGTPSLGALAKRKVGVPDPKGVMMIDYSSRAIDNQIYVSMCSPARDMSAGYHAVGQRPNS
jgi:hypothetical protein